MSISAQLAFVAALVGIEYTLSAGPVVTAGANRLVTLQVTMDDASSVPALTVGSMVIVSGVTYTSPRKGNDLPNGQAQKRMVEYVRTTRVTLGLSFKPRLISTPLCTHDEQSAWYIQQSALRRFTRGAQVLYSNWCADLGGPYLAWNVGGPPGKPEPPALANTVADLLGVFRSSRDEVFVLHWMFVLHWVFVPHWAQRWRHGQGSPVMLLASRGWRGDPDDRLPGSCRAAGAHRGGTGPAQAGGPPPPAVACSRSVAPGTPGQRPLRAGRPQPPAPDS